MLCPYISACLFDYFLKTFLEVELLDQRVSIFLRLLKLFCQIVLRKADSNFALLLAAYQEAFIQES